MAFMKLDFPGFLGTDIPLVEGQSDSLRLGRPFLLLHLKRQALQRGNLFVCGLPGAIVLVPVGLHDIMCL